MSESKKDIVAQYMHRTFRTCMLLPVPARAPLAFIGMIACGVKIAEVSIENYRREKSKPAVDPALLDDDADALAGAFE